MNENSDKLIPTKCYIISGDYVAKVIYGNVHVMDTFECYLDTSYNRNVQCWWHWAHRQGVPEDNIMALKCGSPDSRSEALFQQVPTVDPELSVATLVALLEELDMNDVVKCITDLDINGKWCEKGSSISKVGSSEVQLFSDK